MLKWEMEIWNLDSKIFWVSFEKKMHSGCRNNAIYQHIITNYKVLSNLFRMPTFLPHSLFDCCNLHTDQLIWIWWKYFSLKLPLLINYLYDQTDMTCIKLKRGTLITFTLLNYSWVNVSPLYSWVAYWYTSMKSKLE